MMKVQVIIPIYHPDENLCECLRMLGRQTQPHLRILLIDSGSEPGAWCDEADRLHAEIITIETKNFDHGATRQMGIAYTSNADIHVFLTQDAIPADAESISRLVKAFVDPRVGVAYGRQLPREGASIFAKHARSFNYPAVSRKVTYADRVRWGMKTVFCSNSFAAYRRTAMEETGGFPKHTILSEDMYTTARMLMAGWSSAYVADAVVYHSHDYTIWQEMRRYFDIGVFHSREAWIRKEFGQAEGEGKRFIKDEAGTLLHQAPWLLPSMIMRDSAKFLGYRLGLAEHILPMFVKTRIAMNKRFFDA